MHSEIISDFESLTQHRAAWDDLARHSADPNPFYESWSLLPALQHLADSSVSIILIWQDSTRSRLDGLFPIESGSRYRGLPIRRTTLWRHPYCFLCTPLLRHDTAAVVIQSFTQFIESSRNIPSLLSLSWLPENSTFLAEMRKQDADSQSTGPSFQISGEPRTSQRAMLVTSGTYDPDFLSTIRTKKRKELGRNRRRLSEQGDLQLATLNQSSESSTAEHELDAVIDEFFSLENQGWKKEQGTAIACNPNHMAYFRQVLHEGGARHQAIMTTQRMDGSMIGGLLTFLSSNGNNAYTVKIATSDDYQQYSLGSLIMLDIARMAFESESIQQIDSCAAEEHPMINRLWSDRLQLTHVYMTPANDWKQALIPLTDFALNFFKKFPSTAR